jgi:hypothetical protein
MKKYLYPILFTLFLLVVALASGCGSANEDGTATNPTPTTANTPALIPGAATSADRLTQVILPAGWREADRPAGVQLNIENPSKDIHVFIHTVSKPKDMSFAQYSESARDNLKNYLTSGQVTQTANTTVNGSPAIQYEIQGISGKNDVQYLLTIVDSPKSFFQITGWTLRPKFEQNRNELQQIVQSFKVVAG